MKKLLIIGASILQLPAIEKAKEMGFYVGVVDFDPKAIGIKYADEYFNVSTIDIEGVCKVAKEFKPDGIFTLATDMPMRSIAAACKELNLRGIAPETALKATDKGEMIKAFESHNVPHPWYCILGNEADCEKKLDKISFPCISKPTDNSGSKGVMLIHNEEELLEAVKYSSSQGRNGSVIVEEYMTGSEVSVEIIVLDGEVNILQITDKLTTGAPHFVEMGHSQPSDLSSSQIADIKDVATRAVKAIGIDNSPAHVEIMVTDNGAKMIELGARMGGDCITTHLVPLSTGIDMIKAAIQIACGEKPDLTPKFQKGSAIRFIDAPNGTIKEIDGIEKAQSIPGIMQVSLIKSVGDTVVEINSSNDRTGFVIAQGKTAKEAIEICEHSLKNITISIKAF